MKRRTKSAKTFTVAIRLTRAEFAAIDWAAKFDRRTRAGFVRVVVLRAVGALR